MIAIVVLLIIVVLDQIQVWLLKKTQVVQVAGVFSAVLHLPNTFVVDARTKKGISLFDPRGGRVVVEGAPDVKLLTEVRGTAGREERRCSITVLYGSMGKLRATAFYDDAQSVLMVNVPEQVESDALEMICKTRSPAGK